MNIDDDDLPALPRPFPRRPAPLASRYLDEIYPNLWLGSLQAAESAEILQTCGITDIISITSHRPRIPSNLGITKTHFRLRDNTEADLLSILPECIRKIEEVMSADTTPGGRERKVLVHCRMGISRSGGMVVAYAMKHAGIPARLALEFVRSRRPIVNPNKAFMAQLTVWGECGYDTALLMPDMDMAVAEEEEEVEEEAEPDEEEMLQMALEMSLAASEGPGQTLAAGRLVVVNPDRVPEIEAGAAGAVVGTARVLDVEMTEAATDVTTCVETNETNIETNVTTDIPTDATAPHTELDIEMTPAPDPAAIEPRTPELLAQYEVLEPASTTPPDLHPEQRMLRAAAAAAAEEEWVVITMDDVMRQCFEECVRRVGRVDR
ncbi:uncharacterized protein H6S33_003268 [Morchella sextelata]|uniref:uncharacterized protein n=1 Tax=Morchella sextelata TaxID=1174677 RepID=UPI001D039467|nr:uncharacterized protein H6S33_003268 [Morchella sextelata]KAH0607280.1 hypothetical protein H6S33_003268 [Morchella sextelata]